MQCEVSRHTYRIPESQSSVADVTAASTDVKKKCQHVKIPQTVLQEVSDISHLISPITFSMQVIEQSCPSLTRVYCPAREIDARSRMRILPTKAHDDSGDLNASTHFDPRRASPYNTPRGGASGRARETNHAAGNYNHDTDFLSGEKKNRCTLRVKFRSSSSPYCPGVHRISRQPTTRVRPCCEARVWCRRREGAGGYGGL